RLAGTPFAFPKPNIWIGRRSHGGTSAARRLGRPRDGGRFFSGNRPTPTPTSLVSSVERAPGCYVEGPPVGAILHGQGPCGKVRAGPRTGPDFRSFRRAGRRPDSEQRIPKSR